jgi:porphobilinogen deaminase
MSGPEQFLLEALVADLDGTGLVRAQSTGSAGQAEETGRELAARLLEQGAARILQKLYDAATDDA